MQSTLFYAVLHLMFNVEVGKDILPCSSSKLPHCLGIQASLSIAFLNRQAVRNKRTKVLHAFFLGQLCSSVHRLHLTPGVLNSFPSELRVTFRGSVNINTKSLPQKHKTGFFAQEVNAVCKDRCLIPFGLPAQPLITASSTEVIGIFQVSASSWISFIVLPLVLKPTRSSSSHKSFFSRFFTFVPFISSYQ